MGSVIFCACIDRIKFRFFQLSYRVVKWNIPMLEEILETQLIYRLRSLKRAQLSPLKQHFIYSYLPAAISAGEASPLVNWVDPEGLVSGDPLVTSGYFDWIECPEWMNASEGKMLIGSLLTQKYRF
ncbi:hypothetical protein TNCV_3845231 [Trichonephila clavipes]|nr:hypothetical protein TNCV_3845231 [Trichonephila clavipes]